MVQTRKSATGSPSNGIVTRDQWADLGLHTINLHSGAVVKGRIPDLTFLMAADAVPEKLRGTAVAALNREIQREERALQVLQGAHVEVPELTFDDIVGMAELRIHLAARMVVEPEITEDDLRSGGIPKEDVALLAAIATRETDTDALGIRLGVARLSEFDRFLLRHECDPGCPHCEKRRAEVSARSQSGV